jgi:hypothetical protein
MRFGPVRAIPDRQDIANENLGIFGQHAKLVIDYAAFDYQDDLEAKMAVTGCLVNAHRVDCHRGSQSPARLSR